MGTCVWLRVRDKFRDTALGDKFSGSQALCTLALPELAKSRTAWRVARLRSRFSFLLLAEHLNLAAAASLEVCVQISQWHNALQLTVEQQG